jgi:hypothetical protein
MARQPPRGFKSWHSYNQWRLRHGIERGLTPSQAIGKPKAGEQPASRVERDVMTMGPNGAQVARAVGTKERSTAAKLDDDVKRLTHGDLDRPAYNRRWRGRTVAGVPVPDADRVLALARAGRVGFDDFYPTGPSGVAA